MLGETLEACRSTKEAVASCFLFSRWGGLRAKNQSLNELGVAAFVFRTKDANGLCYDDTYGIFGVGETLFIGTNGGGLAISADGGTTFSCKQHPTIGSNYVKSGIPGSFTKRTSLI